MKPPTKNENTKYQWSGFGVWFYLFLMLYSCVLCWAIEVCISLSHARELHVHITFPRAVGNHSGPFNRATELPTFSTRLSPLFCFLQLFPNQPWNTYGQKFEALWALLHHALVHLTPNHGSCFCRGLVDGWPTIFDHQRPCSAPCVAAGTAKTRRWFEGLGQCHLPGPRSAPRFCWVLRQQY